MTNRKSLVLSAWLAASAWPIGLAGTTAFGAPVLQPIRLVQPNGVAVDPSGLLYISDIGTHRVLRLDQSNVLTVVAGTGSGGFSGDGGPAARARLHAPHDVLVARDGSLLIADTYNHRIRRISRQGVISTMAGEGRGAYAGDNGPALRASLNNPQGLAQDSAGNLYIADTYNHVVRKVDASGKISTFAGSEAGLAGDGGPAMAAQLSMPSAIAVGPDGVYISDSGNNRIRRVKSDGSIGTILGSGPGSGTAGAGFGGDGGPVEKAKIFAAMDLELNPAGDLLVSDSGNHRVRIVSKGIIRTLAGNGIACLAGDGAEGTAAALNTPQKIAVDRDGRVYIADRANHRVRRIDALGRIESLVWKAAGAPPSIGAIHKVGRRK